MDVKTGSGAFMAEPSRTRAQLARKPRRRRERRRPADARADHRHGPAARQRRRQRARGAPTRSTTDRPDARPRLHAVVVALGAEMLRARRPRGRPRGRRPSGSRRALASGARPSASAAWWRRSAARPTSSNGLQAYLPQAPVDPRPSWPRRRASSTAIDTRAHRAGGGGARRRPHAPDDAIDPRVGFTGSGAARHRRTDAVPLGIVHAADDGEADQAAAALRRRLPDRRPGPGAPAPVLERLDESTRRMTDHEPSWSSPTAAATARTLGRGPASAPFRSICRAAARAPGRPGARPLRRGLAASAGSLAAFPHLRAIFSLGAGVDHLLADPDAARRACRSSASSTPT